MSGHGSGSRAGDQVVNRPNVKRPIRCLPAALGAASRVKKLHVSHMNVSDTFGRK